MIIVINMIIFMVSAILSIIVKVIMFVAQAKNTQKDLWSKALNRKQMISSRAFRQLVNMKQDLHVSFF